MKCNPILRTDSYKFSHYDQSPPGTTSQFSYVESRGGLYPQTVYYGLQYYLDEFLSVPITHKMIDYAEIRIQKHMMSRKDGKKFKFNRKGFERIVDVYGGYWPVRIRAVPEGTILDVKNIMMSVENTDPEMHWVTSYLETLLLKVWYPITVATISYECKKIIKKYLEETANDLSGLPFKLHDFGYRGVSSEESAAIGGSAHLVNFMGTDTFIALEFLKEYYGEDMAGYSINATEHSTVTSWKRENEFKAYEHFLEVYKDEPLFACVSDSYNIGEAIKMWGQLKVKIIENGQIVVVRPDSGDPVDMSLFCVQKLDEEFGYTLTKNGYKLLNHVRVIYGDGIANPEVIRAILENLKLHGYSADNMAFGMGGGLLQKCDRDTLNFAMKCSSVTVNGEEVDVYKEPITSKMKISKKGRLDLIKTPKGFKTVKLAPGEIQHPDSVMKLVYLNGERFNRTTLTKIRKRTESVS